MWERLKEVALEAALRIIAMLLLGFATFLLWSRPWWAVKAVRLLFDAAKGAAAYF
jgi:hypothetical protein